MKEIIKFKERSTAKIVSGVRKIIRYNGRLYDVTDFIQRHPGGHIIQFYVNNDEDATEAIQQFHNRAITKVELMMRSFESKPESECLSTKVSKDQEKYQEMSKEFLELFRQLQREGYFKSSWTHVGCRILEMLLLAYFGLYLAKLGTNLGRCLGGLVVGIFYARCGWFMHEGGHYSLTGTPKADRFLQALAMGLGIGKSPSWWRSQHNRHHAMPQRVKHDVDLNTTPLFATNVKIFEDPSEANNVIIRNQAYLFAPIGATLVFLNWRFNLHLRHVLKKQHYFELFLILSHYCIFEYNLGLWPSLLAYTVFGTKMVVNFALSHSHLPVTEEPRHWLEYSLHHTINIQPSLLCDWWMGYLNYQIEHHLFPTMPQYRQKDISRRVRKLAEKHGLPYVCIPYWDAMARTFGNLKAVSKELALQEI